MNYTCELIGELIGGWGLFGGGCFMAPYKQMFHISSLHVQYKSTGMYVGNMLIVKLLVLY